MVKRMCGVFGTEIFLSMENSFKNYPKSSFFPVGSEEGVFYNKKSQIVNYLLLLDLRK